MVKTSIAMLLVRYELLPGSKEMEYEMRFEEQRVPSIKDKVLFKPL